MITFKDYSEQLLSTATLVNLTVEIVGGLSLLLVVFYLIKPKIRISPYIAQLNANNQQFYRFKIVNGSLFYKMFDVSFEVYRAEIVDSGRNTKLEKLTLRKTGIGYLENICVGSFVSDKPHACQVRSDEDLIQILTHGSAYVIFVVKAKHSLSGISKVFSKKYYPECIKAGEFKNGYSLKIR